MLCDALQMPTSTRLFLDICACLEALTPLLLGMFQQQQQPKRLCSN